MVGCNPPPFSSQSPTPFDTCYAGYADGHQGSLLGSNGHKKEHGMLPVLSCTCYFQAPARQSTLVATSISQKNESFFSLLLLSVTLSCKTTAKKCTKKVCCTCKFVVLRIKSRNVMSGYHGSKISGSQQSFLTAHLHCQRWKLSMGYRFVPECNHAQESHTCQPFHCFLSCLQDHGLLRSRNHGNQGNLM